MTRLQVLDMASKQILSNQFLMNNRRNFLKHVICKLSFSPPFCVIKFMTCCCSVRCNAFINLSHLSSVVNRSSKASLRSYAALSPERTLLYCLRLSTSSLSSSSSSPKSGSMMSTSRSFRLVMADKRERFSSACITA